MELNFIILIVLAISFGVLFLIADFFRIINFQINTSLIAGISIAYFFIVVLPEIAENLPEYPLYLKIFEFLFILIGFSFMHVSEKLILQKSEANSQKRMRDLIQMEKNLEIVEKNIGNLINTELKYETFDVLALKHLNQTLSNLTQQSEEIKAEIEKNKIIIQNHVNRDLHRLRYFTNYFYHFLIGLILVGLLFIRIIDGILFFFFAWFKTTISKRKEKHLVFTDLEIYEESDFKENKIKKIVFGLATLTGVFLGLITELFLPIKMELEMIYVLFSFITGVILYTIVREVIPEKEKGKSLYFLIGLVGFTIIIFLLKLTTTIF